MARGHTGTVLKGCSIRKVESHGSERCTHLHDLGGSLYKWNPALKGGKRQRGEAMAPPMILQGRFHESHRQVRS